MLIWLAIGLIVAWFLGLFAFHVTAGAIHLLVVLGVVALIVHFVRMASTRTPNAV